MASTHLQTIGQCIYTTHSVVTLFLELKKTISKLDYYCTSISVLIHFAQGTVFIHVQDFGMGNHRICNQPTASRMSKIHICHVLFLIGIFQYVQLNIGYMLANLELARLLVLQHSHIAPEATYIPINNIYIYICHLASEIGQFVQNN